MFLLMLRQRCLKPSLGRWKSNFLKTVKNDQNKRTIVFRNTKTLSSISCLIFFLVLHTTGTSKEFSRFFVKKTVSRCIFSNVSYKPSHSNQFLCYIYLIVLIWKLFSYTFRQMKNKNTLTHIKWELSDLLKLVRNFYVYFSARALWHIK